jgi:HAMP domain-containing protein
MSAPPVISRRNSLLASLFALAGLVWVLAFGRSNRSSTLGPAADNLELTEVFATVYIPIVALFAVHFLSNLFTLLRPRWSPAVAVVHIAIHAGALLVVLVLLQGDGLVTGKIGAAIQDPAALAQLVDRVNKGATIGLVIIGIIKIVHIFVEAATIRLRRRRS